MATNPSPAGPPKLSNLYYLRATGTAKACSMCGKETTSCLANKEVTDFLYTCTSHLSDPGFARPAPSSSSPSPATSAPLSSSASPALQSEVEKVKKEYEEKAKAKKDGEKDKEGKDSSGWIASSLKTGYSAVSSLATTSASTLFPPPPPVTPSASELARLAAKDAKVWVLNRDVFRMRTDAARKKWQAAEAKQRMKGLSFPSAPRGTVGGAPKPPGV
ncbi:VPS4-associated protein 1 [Leucosporidium creatinivorum]|uniref:VPS4-associated protein 1 n=1 Tax=Leucosporidium creatinivorum TaxID=106004 RepID=A0A1Y2G452_9BASI|nr:VPS4-associated protein 1 [Leucosporidium creatinivorum]